MGSCLPLPPGAVLNVLLNGAHCYQKPLRFYGQIIISNTEPTPGESHTSLCVYIYSKVFTIILPILPIYSLTHCLCLPAVSPSILRTCILVLYSWSDSLSINDMSYVGRCNMKNSCSFILFKQQVNLNLFFVWTRQWVVENVSHSSVFLRTWGLICQNPNQALITW